MPRTQRAFDSKVKELNAPKQRKTRSDKLPEYTKVKSDAKWELGNGNGNIKNTFPYYLHPVKKNSFNNLAMALTVTVRSLRAAYARALRICPLASDSDSMTCLLNIVP